MDFNLSQFGLFLQNDTVFITFHINDTIEDHESRMFQIAKEINGIENNDLVLVKNNVLFQFSDCEILTKVLNHLSS